MLASASRIRRNRLVHLTGKRSWRCGFPYAIRWLPGVVVLVLLAVVPWASAPAQEDDPGRFEIRAAMAELKNGVYFLSGWVEYRLSPEAREALVSGVPLTIRLEVQLLRNRRFWFDNEAASLLQAYELEYHALSERYIVRNLNSGEQASFATLFSALNRLGRIEELPLIDAALLEADSEYEVQIRAVLDTEEFPGPLRLLTFWRRDWSLRSDWYRWQLAGD
jgi:hypothetical protein